MNLLEITELGAYPDFSSVYAQAGYEVIAVNSMRKGLAALKRSKPDIIICEFVYLPTYSMRISNIESLIGAMDLYCADARLIVFIAQDDIPRLQTLNIDERIHCLLTYPVQEAQLRKALQA